MVHRDLAEHELVLKHGVFIFFASDGRYPAFPFPRWGKGRRVRQWTFQRDCFGWQYIDSKAKSNGPSIYRLYLGVFLVVTEKYSVLAQCG